MAGGGGGAGLGGAIFNNGGTITLINSTLTGNTARGSRNGTTPARFTGLSIGQVPAQPGSGLGGAIFNRNGTVTITSSTLSGNTAAKGATILLVNPAAQGGSDLFDLGDGGTAAAIINDSILGQTSSSVTDFASQTINGGHTTASGSHDLIRSPANFSGSFISTADPKLGSFGYYGGLAWTIPLKLGSPAIDMGLNGLAVDSSGQPLTTDERGSGYPRIVGAGVDIGAFEYIDTVAVTAVTPTASEFPLKSGTFKVSRTDTKGGPLTVTLAIDPSSTCDPSDYQLGGNGVSVSGSMVTVVLPAGVTSTNITLTPLAGVSATAASESIILDLVSPGTGHALDANHVHATMALSFPTVNLVASTPTASDSPLKSGTFKVSRTDTKGGPLTVTLAIDPGSTCDPSHYRLSGNGVSVSGSTVTVVLPAGVASSNITLTPLAGVSATVATESVILDLASPGAGHALDAKRVRAKITVAFP
jgi:hypothetical protein